MARLVVETGPAAGSVLEVATRLVLGRAENGIGALGNDRKLSRRHASITVIGTGLVIEDLGSRNGTVVSGRRISHPVAVAVGDLIEIGASRLRVESIGATMVVGTVGVTDAEVPISVRPRLAARTRRHVGVIMAIVVASAVVVTVQLLNR